MKWQEIYTPEILEKKADALFTEQRQAKRLDGWFLVKELQMQHLQELRGLDPEIQAARMLTTVIEALPLQISNHAIFAGTQSDAFARTYALINPGFKVDTFAGYCDPLAVFNDIEPNTEFTKQRINTVKEFVATTPFVKDLKKVYSSAEKETKEVAYFVEQVTGHTIADFRSILANGIQATLADIRERKAASTDPAKQNCFEAMIISLGAAVTLAHRYADLANAATKTASAERLHELNLMEQTLRKVPEHGASNLYEAIQSFMILWQVMCLEQAPNPYAFSVGNIDRILEPYRAMENTSRQTTAGLLCHLLTFFNIGDRSWAISQNLMVGGKSAENKDLTNKTTYAVLDAFYKCNYPQPILSVKLHRNTPEKLYAELGRFFFTPGRLTPSLFNDDSLFEVLAKAGIKKQDLPDYAIAGCQEPLIMGKDNANTTNSWLNLAKILELTLGNGASTITDAPIGLSWEQLGMSGNDPLAIVQNAKELFYNHLDYFLDHMVSAANGCSTALAHLRAPFLSALMGGAQSGIDMRDTQRQGTPYNGSGCLIHGLSVVADSFVALQDIARQRPQDAGRLLTALANNFKDAEDLRQFCASAVKYGNDSSRANTEARELVARVSDMVASRKNYLGNSFRPDWSSPSTHLLYGYWVGATPDGRKAREMLNYGVDPLYGEATMGLGFRMLAVQELPYEKMAGGYASHFGIDPRPFTENSLEAKGLALKTRIFDPLFFSGSDRIGPFYLYLNVTFPQLLRKVLANPKQYAPSGIYIMRIHGTFVNFLDLSPDIQNDIILRLDPASTALEK